LNRAAVSGYSALVKKIELKFNHFVHIVCVVPFYLNLLFKLFFPICCCRFPHHDMDTLQISNFEWNTGDEFEVERVVDHDFPISV
jgi:hypothetical protein